MSKLDRRPDILAAHSPPEPECNWDHAHRLEDHLNDVAAKAKTFASVFGLDDAAYYAGLWHDLGKYREGFQRYIRGSQKCRSNKLKSHKWAGVTWTAQHAKELGPLYQNIAFAIACHHNDLQDQREFKHNLNILENSEYKEFNDTLANMAKHNVNQDLYKPKKPLVINPRWKPPADKSEKYVYQELLTRFLFSALIDADVIDTQEFWRPDLKQTRAAIKAARAQLLGTYESVLEPLKALLDQHMQQLTQQAVDANSRQTQLNQLRNQVYGDCLNAATQQPGIFKLAVPTGGGKTLASMAFALAHGIQHKKRRVIVVLPFTSIIEQSAQIYREIFGAVNVLEHHSAINLEESELKEFGSKYQPTDQDFYHPAKLLSENWDAPIVVTTAVQFLESLHSHKNNRCRKLHNIADSVVIMDEAQMLPHQFMDITLQTLQTLSDYLGVSLVLCTATQPAVTDRINAQGKAQISFRNLKPIIQKERKLFTAMQRVNVHWPEDLKKNLPDDELIDQVSKHEQVLLITHNRRHAFKLAKALGSDWYHLSATMTPEHRSLVIANIKADLAAGRPCRVVSTQVVEAGVDIDFPVVYRALAGFDALAQSAGRCNRNNKLEGKGDFYIFVADAARPPGILEMGFRVALVLLGKAAAEGRTIDLFMPETYEQYFHDLNTSVQSDAHGCMEMRKNKDFRQLGEKFQLINNQHQLSVIVALPKLFPKSAAAIARIRQRQPKSNDYQLLQRSTVNIPKQAAIELVQQGFLEVDQKGFMIFVHEDYLERVYDMRLGLIPEVEKIDTLGDGVF